MRRKLQGGSNQAYSLMFTEVVNALFDMSCSNQAFWHVIMEDWRDLDISLETPYVTKTMLRAISMVSVSEQVPALLYPCG